MSRRKYPCAYSTKLRKDSPRLKCEGKECKFVAQNRSEIRVSYMRGDDEIYIICNHHARMLEQEKFKQFWSEMPNKED